MNHPSKRKIKTCRCEGGFTLLEGVVALFVLTVGMISLLTVATVVYLGRDLTDHNNDEGEKLSSLYDELHVAFQSSQVADEDSAEAVASQVMVRYPGYELSLRRVEETLNFYEVTVHHRQSQGKTKTFCFGLRGS